jgi:hypothetical protein
MSIRPLMRQKIDSYLGVIRIVKDEESKQGQQTHQTTNATSRYEKVILDQALQPPIPMRI